MGKCFSHFNVEQRCEIARRRQANESLRQIAAALDCAPSSIARELKRNGCSAYRPSYADQQAQARRWRGSKLLRHPDLQQQVLEGLALQWSPETVAARLRLQGVRVSYGSIYRCIGRSSTITPRARA